MPRAPKKPTKRPVRRPGANAVPAPAELGDVLTLAEAAAYLRVSEEEILRLTREQGLPGRQFGSEWRFLKSALQDWLRTPAPRGSKKAIMSVAGAWKDDPFLEEMVKEIYERRG